jgi:hypothetical protein
LNPGPSARKASALTIAPLKPTKTKESVETKETRPVQGLRVPATLRGRTLDRITVLAT